MSSATHQPAPARPRRLPCRSSSGSSAERTRPRPPRKARGVIVLAPHPRARPARSPRRFGAYGRETGPAPPGHLRRRRGTRRERCPPVASDILVATPGRLHRPHASSAMVPLQDRGPRARRGRPHARHGLHPGHPRDHRRHLPPQRQTLLFSATMPSEIEYLANASLRDPVRVAVAPVASEVETIDARHLHSIVPQSQRAARAPANSRPTSTRALVFTRPSAAPTASASASPARSTPRRSTATSRQTAARAQPSSTSARARSASSSPPTSPPAVSTCDDSRTCSTYDMPDEPEDYVHRIGRTAHAPAPRELPSRSAIMMKSPMCARSRSSSA